MSKIKVNQIATTNLSPLLVNNDLTVSGTLRATNLTLVSGATNTPIDITYSSFYDKLIRSNLIIGATYRITDYKSVNFLNGFQSALDNPTPVNSNFKPREIYTGDTESLLVKAITISDIDSIVYSENYPEDIIEYIPYSNTISLPISLSSGATPTFDLKWDGNNVYFTLPLNYPALFGKFFGIYAEFTDGSSDYNLNCKTFYLKPINNNFQSSQNSIQLSNVKVENNQTKIVLLDLTFQNYSDYKKGTLTVSTNFSLGNAYGKIIRRRDTIRNIDVPFDFRNQKYRRFMVDLSTINPSLGLGYYGIGDKVSFKYVNYPTTNTYKDFYVFNGSNLFNIDWKSSLSYNEFGNTDLSDLNNVFFGDAHNFNVFYLLLNNTFGNNFSYNTIYSITNNIVNENFSENTMYGGSNNLIGNNFMGNTILSLFFNNSIGNYFGTNNSIGKNFSNNIIGDNFGRGSGGNVIGDYFTSNIIGNDFGINRAKNYIADFFESNIVGNNFGGGVNPNILTGTGVRIESPGVYQLNFNGATHVYQDYNSRIFRASDGNLYLEYFDGTSMQYVSPTS